MNQIFQITRAPGAAPVSAPTLTCLLSQYRKDTEWDVREIPRTIPAAVRERYLEYRRVLLLGGDKNDIEILNAAVGEMEQTLCDCKYDVKELER